MRRLKKLPIMAGIIVAILIAVIPGSSQEANQTTASNHTVHLQEGIWKRVINGKTSTHYIETVSVERTEESAPQEIVLVHDSADKSSPVQRLGYIVPGTNKMFLSSKRGYDEVSAGICQLGNSMSFVRYSFTTDKSGKTFRVLSSVGHWKHID